jgi:rhodanese-related sulfurtransferase
MEFEKSVNRVPFLVSADEIPASALVIDTRPKNHFNKGHLKNSINLMNGAKFETWLGSILGPREAFYMVAENNNNAQEMIEKAAKIGYESNIRGVWAGDVPAQEKSPEFMIEGLVNTPGEYTIVDLRNADEVKQTKAFDKAINIPLPELRERWQEIPTDKPIVVHCAAGYRSAAGSSILRANITSVPVYDLEENVRFFLKEK